MRLGLSLPFSRCLVCEQIAPVIHQDLALRSTASQAQASGWPPQKNVGAVSRPNLDYRSMVTELAGPPLRGSRSGRLPTALAAVVSVQSDLVAQCPTLVLARLEAEGQV